MSLQELLTQNILTVVKPINTRDLQPGDRLKMLLSLWPDCPDEVRDTIFESGFLSEPASTKYHGAYPGGLFDHSMNVAKVLRYFTEIGLCNVWHREISPELIGLLHDFTKVGRYVWDPGQGYIYKNDRLDFGGHGSDSVIKLGWHMKLTEQETWCIRYHMGPFEKDDWGNYGRAVAMDSNVLWTHTADMYASHVLEGST